MTQADRHRPHRSMTRGGAGVVRRWCATAVIAGFLLLPGSAVSGAQARGQAGVCAASESGAVTVVVDFGALGGGTETHCATGLSARSRGSDALAAAGFSWSPPTTQPGFVCRLDGRPSATESFDTGSRSGYTEACVDTAPDDAYWAYWQSSGNGSWEYSNAGLTSSRVKIGGFEGWSFVTGSRSAPGVSPVSATSEPPPDPPPADPPPADPPAQTPPADPPAAANPPPTASSSSTSTSSRPSTGSSLAAPSSREAAATPVPSDTEAPTPVPSGSEAPVASPDPVSDPATQTPASPTSADSATGADTTAASTTAPSSAIGDAATAAGSSDGPLWPTLGGIVLVAALAGAAVVLNRRRRLADERPDQRD